MSTASRFQRVLSLRDRRRPNSVKQTKSPAVGVDFHGLFTLPDGAKKISRDEDKKIQELTQQLTSLGHPPVAEQRLEYVVRHSLPADTNDALRLLMLFGDSVAGVLRPFDPSTPLLGAENREKTTCYLDSILFAMFVKVDVFESLLFNNFADEPRRRLGTILRLWVNMLRAGRLITTDITQHLQQCLADCGWPDAAKIRQQDASEAFGFITDQLELPLVTLKTDIYHSGKEATTDDHKFITERLLEVGIPDDVKQGQAVKLETCLEEYFNNRVEVKRELHRRNTLQTRGSMDKSNFVHVEVVESPMTADATPTFEKALEMQPPARPSLAHARNQSIFSEKRVEIAADAKTEDAQQTTSTTATRQRTNSIRKEVLMPAWQFLNLIPWYTDNSAGKELQIAAHFAQKRPMLGICLKRYIVSKTGSASRLNTHVDVPLEMAAPHFVAPEGFESDGDFTTGQFKLTLQSVICHRGVSLNSGHYIALVRIEPLGIDRHASFGEIQGNSSLSERKDKWVRFDDLAAKRVADVDIAAALHDESPYLLFYRVDPIDNEVPLGNPPPYSENSDGLAPIDHKLDLLAAESEGRRRRSSESERRSGRHSLDAADAVGARPRTSQSATSERVQSVVLTASSVSPSIVSDRDSTADVSERRNSLHPYSNAQSIAQSSRGSQRLPEAAVAQDSSSRAPSAVRIGRPPRASMEHEKRSSMSLSRITSRLGLKDAGKPPPVPPKDALPTEAESTSTKHAEHGVGSVQIKPVKDKKGKSKAANRKKSMSEGVDKPERECTVM